MPKSRVAGLALILASACANGSDLDDSPGVEDCPNACPAGTVCIDGDCVAPYDAGLSDVGRVEVRDAGMGADAGVRSVVGLTVTPTAARLVVENGAPASRQFEARALWSDDTQAVVTASTAWSIDPAELGTFSATVSGLLTVDGSTTGPGTVRGVFEMLAAEASVTVTSTVR